MADAEPTAVVEITAVAVPMPSHETRIRWYNEWEEQTRESRELAQRDRRYYDGDQWTRDEIQALEQRRQPAITKNRIARKVNFILGDEIEKGVDPAARPRNQAHEDDARAATDALRFVKDEQDFDTVRSAVFKDMLIEGYGGALVGGGADDDDECAPLDHVSWDRLFYDPKSSKPNFSDAKYIGIIVWMDLEDAIEAYPDAKDSIEAAVGQDRSMSTTDDDKPHRWVDGKRKRVKIIETYFRIGPEWFKSCDTKGAVLAEPAPTGYTDELAKHNVCPLVMASCYIDGENMRYGMVRALISPQDEINKRSSKSLHLLSVNGVLAERDFIRDPQKFQTELAKPDGYAEVEPDGLAQQRVVIREGGNLAQGHLQMLQEAKSDIDSIGPSSSTLPELPEGASGRAFLARQRAAAKELAPVFASLRMWDYAVFEQDWLRVRQFKTEEWWLRVGDDQELTGYRFVALNHTVIRAQRFTELVQKGAPPPSALSAAAGNDAMTILGDVQRVAQRLIAQAQAQGQQPPPDAMPHIQQSLLLQHPLMQQPVTLNQVAKMCVDIVLDETPHHTILADEQFEKLNELAGLIVQGDPSKAPVMARFIVRASSLPNKRELLAELEKGPDPQIAAAQQQARQLQQAQAAAAVKMTETQAQLNAARAAEAGAKAQTEAQTGIPKAAASIDEAKGQAMVHAANTGEKFGGAFGPPGGMLP